MRSIGKKFSKANLSRVINGDIRLPEAAAPSETFRLDHLLSQQHPEYNRSTLQKFIKQGLVTVNGKLGSKANAQFPASVQIILTVPTYEQKLPPLPVLYEDQHVKVINKPAGLLSMKKGAFCSEPTLEDYGLLVHRLDRDTSGAVILAKDLDTQKMLRQQFQARKVHKVYYAIVEGHPKQPAALIDLPIERNFRRPNTFLISANGKPSQTYYKVLKQSSDYSLLELRPTTGRTHQLRVHLQYLGTPILGDTVYGSGSSTPASIPARLYLHAHSLEITIPNSQSNSPKQRQTFIAPLPDEFNHVL